MNEQELEHKIWEFANEPRNKTKIHAKTKGRKDNCFKKIDEMIQTGQLRITNEGEKEIKVVRVDSIRKEEFESTFKFQMKMLAISRSVIKKLKKPMFQKLGIYKTSEWSSGLRRSIQVTDKKGEFKPRTKEVKGNFENMETYSSALMLFTTRTHIQRSLGLLTKPEAERRIKKCENALMEHFQKLQNENPRDSNAIRQYFKHKRYGTNDFRIA